LHDYKGAIADFNKAIELEPKNSKVYCNRGNTKGDLKDFRGAILDYDTAIELDPNNGKAYYNRAIAYRELDEKETACIDYSKAGELGIEEAYHAIKDYCNKEQEEE